MQHGAPSNGLMHLTTYRNIMPIRASALILSIVSEQVGKGAMSLYLLRRYKVPGWEAISTMVVLGICEIYQLLIFSSPWGPLLLRVSA